MYILAIFMPTWLVEGEKHQKTFHPNIHDNIKAVKIWLRTS